MSRHKVYLQDFAVRKSLVTNAEYLDFINDGGYTNFRYWHAEGWDWVKTNAAKAPMYWHEIDGDWHNYTLAGLQKVDPAQPLTHINYYEATAFAAWKGMRLPTEAEWEVAASQIQLGEALGMDESCLPALPRIFKSRRRDRRIQWQIYGESNGAARRFGGYTSGA